MREARIEMLICKAAGPAPAIGFPSGEGVAVRGGVPVVELVDGERFAAAEQHTVRLCGQGGVAEPHEFADPEALPRQHTRHGIGGAVGIFQRLPQIEEATAFGHGGQTALDGGAEGAAQRFVLTQRLGVQFRIAARQVDPADALRQVGIVQGAEKDKLSARRPQRVQRLGIGEAERFVLRHRDAHRRQGRGQKIGQGRNGGGKARQSEEPLPVQRGGNCFGETLDLLL